MVSGAGPIGIAAGAGILTVGPLIQEDILGGAPSIDQFGEDGDKILDLNKVGNDNRRYYALLDALVQSGQVTSSTEGYGNYFNNDGEILTYEEIVQSKDGISLLGELYGLTSPRAPKEFEDSWDNGHNSKWD